VSDRDRNEALAHVLSARERGDEVVSEGAVQFAIDQTAVRLSLALGQRNPVVVCILHGGLPYTAELLKRLRFPLQTTYVHAGRYGQSTRGSELVWYARSPMDLGGRCVLLVDDIFDRGKTLSLLAQWAQAEGATDVVTTVLVDKQTPRSDVIDVDYPALLCADRYLFGCGMDYRGYWRNLPAIYALPQDMEDGPG
jgi:hypoxanthine phosphoribosyltransferase